MLKAIIHGKAGRISIDGKDERVSWRDMFRSREDLLTAAIFSRWAYLSSKMQKHFICSWFGVDAKTSHIFDCFQDIHFWPKFYLTDNSERSYVEPDVLIQFETVNVLIEVKPPLGGDQYFEQWRNEITGYFSWDENEDKPLYFLAIGRVDAVNKTWYKNIMEMKGDKKPEKINAHKWKQVAESLFIMQKNDNVMAPDRRIISDMLSALELYGVRGHDFLWSDFGNSKKLLPNLLPSIWIDLPISDIEEDAITTTPHDYLFDDMNVGFGTITMEMIKKWQN